MEKVGGNWVKGAGGGMVRCNYCVSILRGVRAEAGKAILDERGGAFWMGIGVREPGEGLTL